MGYRSIQRGSAREAIGIARGAAIIDHDFFSAFVCPSDFDRMDPQDIAELYMEIEGAYMANIQFRNMEKREMDLF